VPLPEPLDEATRDRFIAHGRQDATHVLLLTLRLESEVKEMKQLIKTIRLVIVVLCLAFLLLLAWAPQIWWR
jgi:hypothetical protein